MKVVKIAGYRICDKTYIKLINTGHIMQIIYSAKKSVDCPIRKINSDEYLNLSTGEILKCNHIENRSQNVNSVRLSISKLRNIINNNFSGGKNELWITLTFGNHKVYNPKELYPIFVNFIKRLRYYFKNNIIDYIYVPEPHLKGDWHIHLLLKSDNDLFIENSKLNSIWGYGFVKVNRLCNVDNIGAYVSAYLTNIKDGDKTAKGARLYLYPKGHQIYRFSKGIKIPIPEIMSYEDAKNKVKRGRLTFQNTFKIIDNDEKFINLIHKEYYNLKS